MFCVRKTLLRHRAKSSDLVKKFCSEIPKAKGNNISITKKQYGQPSPFTHPHLLCEDEVTPMIKRFEYENRRQKLIEGIVANAAKRNLNKKDHLIVIPAATKQFMSDKIPYVFRQNTDFLYLTGCQEPDCCVVLSTTPSPSGHCSTLFTRNKDEHAEVWDGPRTHCEDAPAFFGVNQSLPMSELPNFLYSYAKSNSSFCLWYDFLNPVQRNVHKVVFDFMNETNSKNWESPKECIHKLRLYKSPSEIALMQMSCDIASKGFIETMSLCRPGINENQIYAKIDYECRMRGAEYLAYPPVVAGGDRATIIHYINNNQVVGQYEMVLMDAGCEYHGYSSDITRTFPVNGKFSPQQREIYEIVLCVQEELIELLNTRPTLDSLFESMCFMLGKKLQSAGLIGVQPSNTYLMKAAYQLCPHHVSHYLGMDIHDTPMISRNIKIEPGMIITVEPGIYITPTNTLLPKEYRGIGVRIEDDILITVNGPVVLSRKCPKRLEEIEKIINSSQ